MKKAPALSDAEWDIMKILWDEGPLPARDIVAQIPKSRAWSDRTVKTMLARLVKKGALIYDQVGNSYLYKAALSRDAMTRRATASFVSRVFDGAMTPFLAGFADHASEEELRRAREELDRIIEERRGK